MSEEKAQAVTTVTYRRVIRPADFESIEATASFTVPAKATPAAAKKQAEQLLSEARDVAEGEFGLKLAAAAGGAVGSGPPPTQKTEDAEDAAASQAAAKAAAAKAEAEAAAKAKAAEAEAAAQAAILGETKTEEPAAPEISDADFKKFLIDTMQKISGAELAKLLQEQFGTTEAGKIDKAKRADVCSAVNKLIKGG